MVSESRVQTMRTAVVVLAGFLVVPPLLSQTSRQEITVEVIEVPVYVFSSGKPLRNLTKDDFELAVNGKRQQIDYFARTDFAAAPAAAQNGAPPAIRDPRQRRLFLLLFDLVYTSPAALASLPRCQKAAIAMIDHALPEDFFAVAIYTSPEAKYITAFTRDRDVLRRAVISIAPSRAHDALAISITQAERQTEEAWMSVGGSSAGGGRGAGMSGEDPNRDIMAQAAVADRERAKGLVRDQLSDFSGIAARMAGLEGFKQPILFSEGFESSLLTGDTDVSLMLHRFRSMVETFAASNILLDTVSVNLPSALNLDRIAPAIQSAPTPGSPKVDALNPPGNETLSMFASQTGGQFIHNTNDITGGLADLSTSCSVVYNLGFKPVNPRKGANTIDVKLKNAPRGTTISFRKGFDSTPEKSKGIDPLRLADIIQNDIPQTGTPPVITFGEKPFLEVVIPARQLAKEFGAIQNASILLYVFDAKGMAVVTDQKLISIPAEPPGDIIIRAKLALPPGDYVAKSILTIGTSIGFAKQTFTIPGQSQSSAAVGTGTGSRR